MASPLGTGSTDKKEPIVPPSSPVSKGWIDSIRGFCNFGSLQGRCVKLGEDLGPNLRGVIMAVAHVMPMAIACLTTKAFLPFVVNAGGGIVLGLLAIRWYQILKNQKNPQTQNQIMLNALAMSTQGIALVYFATASAAILGTTAAIVAGGAGALFAYNTYQIHNRFLGLVTT